MASSSSDPNPLTSQFDECRGHPSKLAYDTALYTGESFGLEVNESFSLPLEFVGSTSIRSHWVRSDVPFES
jgi:hypothetical protein